MRNNGTRVIIGVTAAVMLAITIVFGVAKLFEFNMGCNQYLKRASNANTVELASQNLETAIRYLEGHNLTNGVVSIFLHQPKNDIGFWYSNLKASQNELAKVVPETTQMERSNLLMKLRETLLDDSAGNSEVTCPSGIAVYPYNTLMFCLLVIPSVILAVVVGVWFWEN